MGILGWMKDQFIDVIEWLGELVRQVDSSLVDEWEALVNPAADPEAPVVPPAPPSVLDNRRAFVVLVRNELFRRVQLAALQRDDDPEQYLRELIAALQAGPNYWWAYRSVAEHDSYALLPEVKAPLLFVNVLDDNQYDLTRRAHEATAGSKYVELPGPDPDKPGWVGFATQYPEEFGAALLAFL